MGRINLLTSSVFFTISWFFKNFSTSAITKPVSDVIKTAKTKITKGGTKKISNFLTQQKIFFKLPLKTTEMAKAVFLSL